MVGMVAFLALLRLSIHMRRVDGYVGKCILGLVKRQYDSNNSGKASHIICFRDQTVNSVADPFEVHGSLREVLTRDFDVPMLTTSLVFAQTRVLGRLDGPSNTREELELMNGSRARQRETRDRHDNSAFRSNGVLLLSDVVDGTDDERSRVSRRNERLAERW
jgi:hypothetical protein